jgi:proteasome lid subunit RPN8/RPN11
MKATFASCRAIALAGSALSAIRQEAERAYPGECCGFLLGRDTKGLRHVAEIVPALNRVPQPSQRQGYAIAPDDYRAGERTALARDLEIVGFYHSHPDAPAVPSPSDLELAWPWYAYAIASVSTVERVGPTRSIACWVLREDRQGFESVPLIENVRAFSSFVASKLSSAWTCPHFESGVASPHSKSDISLAGEMTPCL